MQPIHKWKDKLLDEPCFIVGNGPSATDESLSLLTDHFTIGINRAFLLLDPTILFWLDNDFEKKERDKLNALEAIKVCRDVADPKRLHHRYHLDHIKPFNLVKTPNKLNGCGASGPLAFQFAYALGCSPLILIGFDCCYRNGVSNFYGSNKSHHDRTLPNCLRGLQWIKSTDNQVDIINCSANEVFPTRQKLSEVVTAYGKGKGRSYYADRLLDDTQIL